MEVKDGTIHVRRFGDHTENPHYKVTNNADATVPQSLFFTATEMRSLCKCLERLNLVGGVE